MRKVCITENCLSFLVLSSHFITKKTSDNYYQPNIPEENIEKENDCNTTFSKQNRPKKVSRSNDYEKSKVSFALL